ncbi:MAG: N-6 DNA methylase [Chloroflexi bacterium]|nr:N-6 DNA methylase [Chloroflexota bacterium]
MSRLTTAVETYFADLRRIRATGGATAETSRYTPLENLLNAVGASLKPKVFGVGQLANLGAGHPDFGLYAAKQVQRGQPREGQRPEHGVVEVKPIGDDAWVTAGGDQVSRYWGHYRLVLVTNYRDFVLVGEDAAGLPAKLETFRLAANAEDFDRQLDKPRAFANRVGAGLAEYLLRVFSHRAVRGALEEALGVKFEGERGAAFFRSTLVQTLFYGVFSAWVLWARQTPPPAGAFDWRTAVWHLRAPVLRALFQQLSDPGRLQPLGLVEVLDWTNAALDRVDQAAFFARFNEGEAVPYFYEPFLQAFDPALRKQLGVWYTPAEVVRCMVARVDRALRDDLGIADGLAAENVYVLDPCCGTGAYLAEVLRRIAANLRDRSSGALTGAHVKRAALDRVFGFEIMPAPFVVAHLQVGITLQELDAPLAEDGVERAGVFLTNALTGWEPTVQKPLPFPELEEERDRAERVKRETPILVILGNPPYNGFAGMAVDEERELSEAYRTTRRVRRPEGQGLNDLYVRFFRMAERRIAEKTGQGVVCFISNYSWLDSLSCPGMRERYLDAFDTIRIDNLNGDKYRTGKVAPDGSPDPSIFSTPDDPVGIQVGTAVATLVRKFDHSPAARVQFRNLWGQAKLAALAETAEAEPEVLYDAIEPVLPLGLPFAPVSVSRDWFDWPALPDLFPTSFPGVKTSRDAFLVDTDLDRLKARAADYFDPAVSNDEIARRYPGVTRSTRRFSAPAIRDALLRRGGPTESGFVQYAYRPFDTRDLYWEAETKLLDEKRSEYWPHAFAGNLWLILQKKARPDLSPPLATGFLGDLNQMNSGVYCVPCWLSEDGLGTDGNGAKQRPNLSPAARRYLERLDLTVEDLFHHVLAVLHAPGYNTVNADALRAEGPRIPLPHWAELSAPSSSGRGASRSAHSADDESGSRTAPTSDQAAEAAQTLTASAARGRELAALLDPDTPVPGVTTGQLRPELAAIAVPATTDDSQMDGDDFALTAGWGHFGSGEAVMPGQGRAVERAHTQSEREALLAPSPWKGEGWGEGIPAPLGDTTFDIYLNNRAYWRNVPADVWRYKLGGYQVLKKWLSYREQTILDRPLRPEEVQHFTDTARRIAAILSLTNTTER